MQRPDAAQRTRLRQHSTSNTTASLSPQNPHSADTGTGSGSGSGSGTGTLTTSPANPLTSTPLLASHLPILRNILPAPQILLPDDDADHVLPVVYAVLDRNGNRAMSLKELGEVAFSSGLLKTSPSAAQQSIGTHIRNHMQRHADNPQNALLSYYKLEGGSDDVRVGAALFRLSPRSGRKGTMVWFLSRATGKPCPFERIGVNVQNNPIVTSPVTTNTNTTTTPTTATAAAPLMPSTASAATIPALLPPVVASLKRKIPPDDVADSHRPTKIRITLRLPPRTPIPKRPRPIVPAQFYSQLSQHPLASSDEDSSSSGNTDSSSEEEDDDDDDDEDMIDDFNSLVADDTPIAIPCARSGPTFCLSRPFYDTCEPPPDSEDEDEDFHNSMLRPELEEDEDLQPKDEDYFDIKEEEIADFVLDLATPESLIAAQQPAVVVAVKVEDGVDVTCQPMTARPELEWSGLKLDESMFNPLVDMLARTDSPAASAEIEETGTSSVSPAPGPGRGGSISAESSLALAVPPPTPWIKTEEESAILLEDKPSSSISPHGEDVIEDDPFPIVDDHFAPVQSPMDTLPVHQPPWEHGWAASSSIGGGPESVTTDEVDLFDSDPPQRDGIQASTSAPHFTPLSQPQPRARRPLRLSVSGLHPFHDGIRGHQLSGSSAAMRAGHARRHSHAAGITTLNHRRMSIISNAFSDWASGTPEDSEAPLTTPSHTAWRHYQWPGANGSSSTLAHERIEERSVVDEDGSPMEEEPKADLQRQSPPQQAQKQHHQSSSAPPKVDSPLSLKDELDQLLTSTTFNQVTIRALPAGHRMSTLVLLGIPVFQYSVEYPPIELIRRMDTDFINISSLIIYGRFVAQAATGRSRAQSNAAAPASQSTILPAPPTADELPPNHIMINSGARAINGGWVSLSVARSVAKNYHDLPTFVRRMFLSEGLADKFPEPIPYVKSLLASRRQQGEPGVNAFGKPFAKPSSLSAHELLAGPSATAAAASSGSPAAIVAAAAAAGMGGALSEAHPLSPAVRRPGGPIGANPSGLAVSRSYPLSPVAALSNVNAIFGKAHPSEPSLLSLATALAPAKGWTPAMGRTQPEPEEPLKPEEEEMLKAILKSPPRKSVTAPVITTTGNESDSDAEMSVDEDEEQEVVREVVDIGSEVEQEEEKVPETKATAPPPKRQVQPQTRNTRSKDQKKSPVTAAPPVPIPAPAPRRSLRRMQSISSLSSELTVSESESSAPPPSLDRRPALKGKSTNIQQPVSPVEPNGKKKGSNVTLPLRRNATEPTQRVKIIEVDEPTAFQKPRRSERTAKNEPAPVSTPAPTMTERSSKRLQKGATVPIPTTTSSVVVREDSPPPTAVVGKTRRSLAQQKEKESAAAATVAAASPQAPTTRPGALRPTPAKRSLRSRG